MRPRLGLAQPPRGPTRTLLLGCRGRREPPGLRGAALRARRRQSAAPGFSHAAQVQSRSLRFQDRGPARAGPRQAAWWVPRAWETPACAGGLRAEVEPGRRPRGWALGLSRVWVGGPERAPGTASAGQAGGASWGSGCRRDRRGSPPGAGPQPLPSPRTRALTPQLLRPGALPR